MAIGGLGAGLDILFSDNTSEIQVKKTLRISEIEPNRNQPRKFFNEEAIASLAESIRENGMLQPILVRPLALGGYQIVAGERRWRAARMLGLDEVPVNIHELSDIQAMQIAVIENLQRENLNPIEEANSYCDLIERYGMTQEQVAKMTGRSRSAIANAVRMLSLPETVLYMVETGSLSAGHAKALVSIVEDVEFLTELAEKASDGKMTVRQIENEIRRRKNVIREEKERYIENSYFFEFEKEEEDSNVSELENEVKDSNVSEPEKEVKDRYISEPERDIEDNYISERERNKEDNYFSEMEIALNVRLGRKVKVKHNGEKGSLVLEFYNKDDLKTIAEKLAKDYE